ncbi:MAG: ferredoxin--NADP reductase, partial [Bacteroidota bacterium]
MSHEFHSLTVSEVVKETADATSVYFEVPENLSGQYAYQAGQYLTLRFELNGEDVRRAYSLCTSPVEGRVGVNVKRVNKGLVSNHINDNLKPGDQVQVMQPDGTFGLAFSHDLKRDYYFFAAGSGITPIMSLIKTIVEEEPMSRCHLLYGNRNEDSIIFKNEIDALQQKYAGQIDVVHTLSSPNRQKAGGLKGMFSKGKISWTGWQGRINGTRIDTFLENHPKVGKEAHYFVCGPGAMIDTIIDHLEKKGVGEDRIHAEHFVSSLGPAIGSADGVNSEVTVHLAGQTYQVNVPADKTILDVLIKEKVDAPYSCTSGACSTCVGKVITGEVAMDACYALD